MNLQQYRIAQLKRREEAWQPRARCHRCKNPTCLCYCSKIRPFESHFIFVILIHRGEARRSIATGRMAHLILTNSLLIEGLDYSGDEKVNDLIRNPNHFPVLLYPGPTSKDLSRMVSEERSRIFPVGKKPVIFILDGTWSHAKRMKRLSKNLSALPRVQFTPETPSNFRVREQPHDQCYSTVEAIHELSRLLSPDPEEKRRNLLEVFDYMVDLQLLKKSAGGGRRKTGQSA